MCVYTGDITEELLLDFQVPSQPYSPGQPPPFPGGGLEVVLALLISRGPLRWWC